MISEWLSSILLEILDSIIDVQLCTWIGFDNLIHYFHCSPKTSIRTRHKNKLIRIFRLAVELKLTGSNTVSSNNDLIIWHTLHTLYIVFMELTQAKHFVKIMNRLTPLSH